MKRLAMESPLGALTLVEADGRLVALEWGRTPDSDATTPLLARAKAAVEAYFAGSRQRFDLPLGLEGSAFQKKAWAAMAAIPWGEVRTYGDLAARIGSSARAMGAACRTNPLPIVIPCHRVVGAGGALTRYSGGDGLSTKQALLALEGALGRIDMPARTTNASRGEFVR